MIAQVTFGSFNRWLESLRLKFMVIFFVMVLVASALASSITRLLLSKLKNITIALGEIKLSGDFSRGIAVKQSSSRMKDKFDVLAAEFNQLLTAVHEAQGKLAESQKAEALAVVVAQVAQDIRSPLTSTGIALIQAQQIISSNHHDPSLTEPLITVKHCIDRVSGILKKLSATYGSKKNEENELSVMETPKLTLMDKVIHDVAVEQLVKLGQPDNFKVNGFSEVANVWGVLQVSEIQSALSNILNNAFYA